MENEIIIITGMHRSGTSMVSGILNLCGVYFGDNLQKPMKENPKGFFEDLEFMQINKDILKYSGGSWDNPPKQIIANTTIRNRMVNFIDKWKGFQVVGLKDPRCCLTLGLWRQYIKKLKVVLVSRDMEEIAISLNKRNGFDTEKSKTLYKKYIRDFKKNYTGPYIMAYHRDFIEWPIESAKILLKLLDLNLKIPEKNIIEFVDVNLYRSKEI